MDLNNTALCVFTICNAFRVLAYFPQIVLAARDSIGCASISCTTWSIFFVANLSAVWHALANLNDAFMAITFAVNAFFCFVIMSITFVKRLSYLQSKLKPHVVHGVLGSI